LVTTEEITPVGTLATRKVPHLLLSQREHMALRSALAYLKKGVGKTDVPGMHAKKRNVALMPRLARGQKQLSSYHEQHTRTRKV
jgi:hypothetical protein